MPSPYIRDNVLGQGKCLRISVEITGPFSNATFTGKTRWLARRWQDVCEKSNLRQVGMRTTAQKHDKLDPLKLVCGRSAVCAELKASRTTTTTHGHIPQQTSRQ